MDDELFWKESLFLKFASNLGITEKTRNYNRILQAFTTAAHLAEKRTAKRCKEIAQQRYLAENQAVDIDAKISEEFKV